MFLGDNLFIMHQWIGDPWNFRKIKQLGVIFKLFDNFKSIKVAKFLSLPLPRSTDREQKQNLVKCQQIWVKMSKVKCSDHQVRPFSHKLGSTPSLRWLPDQLAAHFNCPLKIQHQQIKQKPPRAQSQAKVFTVKSSWWWWWWWLNSWYFLLDVLVLVGVGVDVVVIVVVVIVDVDVSSKNVTLIRNYQTDKCFGLARMLCRFGGWHWLQFFRQFLQLASFSIWQTVPFRELFDFLQQTAFIVVFCLHF